LILLRISRGYLTHCLGNAFDVLATASFVLGDGTVAQAAREAQAAIRKASPWLQA